MRSVVILAIAFLSLFTVASVVWAWPGVTIIGNTFSEDFLDGFDHPDAVATVQNVVFDPGLARLLDDGALVYDFAYEVVQSEWGTADALYGSFWVSFLDELQDGGALVVLLETEEFGYGPAIQIRLEVVQSDLLVSVDIQDYPTRSATVPRSLGVTHFGFDRSIDQWAPTVVNADGHQIDLFDLNMFGPIQPRRLSISGHGFAIDAITIETYTAVGTDTQSWSSLKSAY